MYEEMDFIMIFLYPSIMCFDHIHLPISFTVILSSQSAPLYFHFFIVCGVCVCV